MSDDNIERQIRYLAMIRIFERHITNFCSVHSDSLAEAEDLMQEVFADLWEKIGQLRADSTPAQQNRWLRRLMITTLVRHLRHNPFYYHVPLKAAQAVAVEEDRSAEQLEEILACLAPGDRQVIDARLQGYNYAEIAAMLKTTPEAVKQRVYRIMKILKKNRQ